MTLDVQKFISERRPDWEAFEAMLQHLEDDARQHRLDVAGVQHFHYLYERAAADLTSLSAYAVEPQTRSYLELLVARGFGEMHGNARRLPLIRSLLQLVTAFPQAVRRHFAILLMVLAIFGGGMVFGGLALALDETAKPVLMPFPHLLGDPSERVAEEEATAAGEDPMEGAKSTFSAYLMTHNTKVAIFTLALGMTFGIGTGILLFYNGVMIGAVMMDYVLSGESVFLSGWLLPHGSVEIPAIPAGRAGWIATGTRTSFRPWP